MTSQILHRLDHDVTIAGESTMLLSEIVEQDKGPTPLETTLQYECLSGGWIESEWRGYPVDSLVKAANGPSSSTHVLIESVDEQRGCVPIGTAMEGLLAFRRDDERLDGLRFVAPDITGPRTVKDVHLVEMVELAPHEQPQDYETFTIETDD